MSSVLVIDDEAVIRSALTTLLGRHGFDVETAGSVQEAEQYQLSQFDLIIADLRLPGDPGTDVIAKAGGTPVLIMTSYASVRSAVESMRQGAVDYIAKPFDHEEMMMVVDRIIKESRLQRQNEALKSDLRRQYPVSGMIGDSNVMRDVFGRIAKVAPTHTNVLILGESGTGKELVARAIHEASPRSDGPIIAVNCGAISDDLIESELFGHERGAFTGAVALREGLVEAANGGTLFLDEIAELTLTAQAGLLRVLQDGEVRRVGSNSTRKINVRVVAATNRDLEDLTRTEAFREDVYFRLRVMEIQLPPLRARGDDVEKLADFLLKRSCERLNKPALQFDRQTLALIRSYHWPGNVRELENAVERAVILCDGETITPGLLAVKVDAKAGTEVDMSDSLDDYFCNFVRQHEPHMTETELARRLGVSRKTLWERRQKLGIPRRKGSDSR
ncbi:MAG: sigma-54 dependent transcriptional regulator [Gammaproteobacteria bacterium]|nr:sigma-54 dependent transcriptional regulator [Gammaproteobacteria bacterium]